MKNKWSLVIHQASQHTVAIWVGTLFSDLRKYEQCQVNILDQSQTVVATQTILTSQWLRPFKKLSQRFYKLLEFDNLNANTRYFVEFKRLYQKLGDEELNESYLARGQFKTLPAALCTDNPFVVALGSCFYSEKDNGQAAKAYSQLYFNGDVDSKPDIKFLTGDQVYLDIGLDSLSPIAKDIRNRIADDYAISWQLQRKMLRNGATWFLADDHEYWNNFPHTSSLNPYLWMITAFDKVKTVWQETAKCGVERVQQISTIRTFDIGSELSFCVADCRTYRDKKDTPQAFLPQKDFQHVLRWINSLTGPGVLVLPQPLLVNKSGSEDFNLASHTEQYSALVLAISESNHDIVCLSGDVHFARIASVSVGAKGKKLYEVISSPMSNLTGVDGKVATATPYKLKEFPAVEIKNLIPQKVTYQKNWSVSTTTVKKWYLPNYKKTKEHFMTVGFKKQGTGVEMSIQAWKVREQDRSGLPKKEFSSAVRFNLT